MTTPDHAENTGDNLRHAAEEQEQAQRDGDPTGLVTDGAPETPLPDFNS